MSLQASNNNKKRGRNESIYKNFHINEKKIYITLKKKKMATIMKMNKKKKFHFLLNNLYRKEF